MFVGAANRLDCALKESPSAIPILSEAVMRSWSCIYPSLAIFRTLGEEACLNMLEYLEVFTLI